MSASAALSAWCAPCSGSNTSAYDARRRVQVDEPAADGEHVLAHAEVDVAAQHVPRRAVEEEVLEPGIGLAEDERRVGLHDARLLGRDLARASNRGSSTWSIATFVITATRVSSELVASHVPPSPTSTTATSTARSANHENAAAVSTSKYDGWMSSCVLDDRDRAQQVVELVVGDGYRPGTRCVR